MLSLGMQLIKKWIEAHIGYVKELLKDNLQIWLNLIP